MADDTARPAPPANAIGHVDIPAADFGRACAFYADVFGWRIRTMPDFPGFALFDDGGVGGAVNARTDGSPPGVRPYVTVTDIDATLAAVVAHGGAVLQPRTEIGGGNGFVARFRDSEGNCVGLWSQG